MAFLYCPECRAEYLPGVLKCADCGVPLVRELPARRAQADIGPAGGAGEASGWRRGETSGEVHGGESGEGFAAGVSRDGDRDASDSPDAELEYVDLVCVYDGFAVERYLVARSLLESAGIEVFPAGDLQPFHGVSMSPGVFGGGQGAYRLWVRPDEAEEARAVLAEAAAESPDAGTGTTDDDDEEPSG